MPVLIVCLFRADVLTKALAGKVARLAVRQVLLVLTSLSYDDLGSVLTTQPAPGTAFLPGDREDESRPRGFLEPPRM
ncbi:MAG: hypothetical protein WBA92_13685 [Pseudorhodobacter sp.]